MRSPRKLLAQTHDLLAADGTLVVIAPNVGGTYSKLLLNSWLNNKREHLFYFDKCSLAATLRPASFEVRRVPAFSKFLDLSYIRNQLLHARPWSSHRWWMRSAPCCRSATHLAFPVFAGSMMAMAHKR